MRVGRPIRRGPREFRKGPRGRRGSGGGGIVIGTSVRNIIYVPFFWCLVPGERLEKGIL